MNVFGVVKYLAVSVVLWWTEGQGDWVLVLHHVLDGDGKGFICSLEIVEEVFLTDTTPFMGTLPYPLRGIIYDNINLKFSDHSLDGRGCVDVHLIYIGRGEDDPALLVEFRTIKNHGSIDRFYRE